MQKIYLLGQFGSMLRNLKDVYEAECHYFHKCNWSVANNSNNDKGHLSFNNPNPHLLSNSWNIETLVCLVT